MSWIEDIGTYLQTSGIGTVGTDIFYTGFDASVHNCITLYTQPGLPEEIYLTKDLTLRKPELGVRVRNSSDSAAYQKAYDIYNLLDMLVNTPLGSTRFKRIKAIADPFFLEQDLNYYYIYSINFNVSIG